MAQKKRQDAGFAKLKKDLSENNLGNLYLFYGEEDYLRDYYIQQVQKKLLTEGMETFNPPSVSGERAGHPDPGGLRRRPAHDERADGHLGLRL